MTFNENTPLKAGNLYGVVLSLCGEREADAAKLSFILIASAGDTASTAIERHGEFTGLNYGDYTYVMSFTDLGEASPEEADEVQPSPEHTERLLQEIKALAEVYNALIASVPNGKERIKQAWSLTDEDFNRPVGTRLVHSSTGRTFEKASDGSWFDLERPENKLELPDEVIVAAMR